MSSTPPQAPIPDVDFADNTNQRTPCVLILDGSGSMAGEPIDSLNKGLAQLESDLAADTVARERVRLLVLAVGGRDEVNVVHDWADAINFKAPTIAANGSTPLGKALDTALERIEDAKRDMKQAGVAYTRPLIYMITDGQPTDPEWDAAAGRCRSAIAAKKVQLFAIGTGDQVSYDALRETGGTMLKLKGLNFKELFQFLSASVSSASQAAPGQNTQVTLPASISVQS
jgi:uncharacterized protein YegL